MMAGTSMGRRVICRRHHGGPLSPTPLPVDGRGEAPVDGRGEVEVGARAMAAGAVRMARTNVASTMTSTMLRKSTILSGSKMRTVIVSKKIGTATNASSQQLSVT